MATTSARRLVAGFLLGALAFVAAVPLLGTWRRGALPASASTAFDVDPGLLDAGGLLRRAGVSTRPRQVVVGKDGWLFPGDQYAQALSVKRQAASAADLDAAQRIADATRAWRQWLAGAGVRDYWVLVCADKDSVYPDRLPDWDRPAGGSAMDATMARADPAVVVDSRPALRRERAFDGPPLYARTDSHWTARGAWAAYRALAQAAARTSATPAWLHDGDVGFAAIDLPEGDLGHILPSAHPARDTGARATFAGAWDDGRTQGDAATGVAVSAGSLGIAQPLRHALRIVSPHALNRRRLLWLQDSTGAALLPYVAATFAEVIEIDRASTTPAQWGALVRSLRPDAVLVSVVERNARADWFQALPPSAQ